MTNESEKTKAEPVDWGSIELHYRAGIKPVRQIGEEYGVSHTAIAKRAKRDDWTRDLAAKIHAKAADKVARAEVAKTVSMETKISEQVIVEANANLVASAELVQRDDILMGLEVTRGLLRELATLSRPDLLEVLERIGEACDDSYTDENGRFHKDKVNELYMFIISLPGRVKSAKEISATHGVYIPLQRKVLRMEDEANRSQAIADELLDSVIEKGR